MEQSGRGMGPQGDSSNEKPTRSRRFRKSFLIFLLAAAIVVGTAYLLRLIQSKTSAPVEETNHSYQTATLSAVGDLSVDAAILEDAKQADGSYDFTRMFLNVAGLLSESDLTVGNLECNFSGEPYGEATCSAPESLAKSLNTLGFDILQTANSKSLSGGLSGLSSTLNVLQSNSLQPLGTYASEEERNRSGGVLLKEVNGIKIAFVAFTKGFDGMSIPAGSEFCANLLYEDYDTTYSTVNKTQITKLLDAANALSPDVIVAMVHWGSEFKMSVSATQTEIADLMFAQGVDVILGSHSHMVGPMEEKTVTTADGSEKTVFLANSLGNFLSSESRDFSRESAVLNLEFRKDDATGKTEISNVNYVPVYLADGTETASGRFELLDVYQSIALYDSSYLDRVSDTVYGELQGAVTDLASHTGTALDRGPQ